MTHPLFGAPEAPVDWSALDDAQLLRAHVAGSPDAFQELFSRHRDRLWSVALRTMRDPADAADALQDAMVSAFRRAGSFRGDAQVLTWLHRIVMNACLDRIRRNAVRRAEPLPDDLDRDGLFVAPDDPARDAERHELRDQVGRALSLLNADQRAALVLVDMQGYSVDQAAAVLGCAPGTIKSRCARGRARLAPLLAPLMADTGAGTAAATGEPDRGPVRPNTVRSRSARAPGPEHGNPDRKNPDHRNPGSTTPPGGER